MSCKCVLTAVLLAAQAIPSEVSAGMGIRSRIERVLARGGEISEWRGVALTPRLVKFTCEQTGASKPDTVVATVRAFRTKAKAYWPRPIGASRHERNGRYGIDFAADVEHQVWLAVEPALTNGETRVFDLPDGKRVPFRYDAATPSPIIKLNQLGTAADAGEKYAYVGEWAGTAGEIQFTVAAFRVVEAATGRVVYEGRAKRRQPDSFTPDGHVPWTGEQPWELDFSSVTALGRYYLDVDGIGRSETFALGPSALDDAFAVHLAGMKRQRCGETCHRYALRGNFAPDDFHYAKGDGKRQYGFFNTRGESVTVNHFRLIQDNLASCTEKVRVPGGWHDAADYDRRPFHLQAVGDLAALALLEPACAAAREEAYWGLRHLLAVQQADGGVGTWIETVSHPSVGEGPTSEPAKHVYCIAHPTRASTLEFAAYAAEVAMAFQAAEQTDDPRFAPLTNAAVRAWRHALDKRNGQSWTVDYAGEKLVYRQNPELPGELLIKAGVDLSFVTGDDGFLKPVEEDVDRVLATVRRGNWRWSPFILMELDIHRRMLTAFVRPAYKAYAAGVREQADLMLRQLDKSWAYRTPWYPFDSWHAKNLGWGYGLPLARARWLVAAHAITWQRKYLDGAYLANDFHNGANPEGETYTSGLGVRPTRRYLDLEGKYPAGVTPFRLTYGIEWKCAEYCLVDDLWKQWPIWRRYGNLEIMSVKNAEFSVWETIAPAAVVTGYLAAQSRKDAAE